MLSDKTAQNAGEPALAGKVSGRRSAGHEQDGAPDDAGAVPEHPAGSTSLSTTELTVRPPADEVNRRASERDEAVNAKPLLGRILQVLLAVLFPLLVIVAAIRAITTTVFLWIEYHRPGFPADGFGFSTEDRMTYGSYAMDYLLNFAPARYLADTVTAGGETLFAPGEAEHMADVKTVIQLTFLAAAILLVIAVLAMVYLRRHYPGGIRRGLFAGAAATLVLMVGLAVVALLGWQRFFAGFHAIFFADGTWTFAVDDTLIRLFPAQFWMDSAMAIAAIVLLAAVLTLIFTWPTAARRRAAASANERSSAQR